MEKRAALPSVVSIGSVVSARIASVLAGWLWQTTGSNSTFLMGALLAATALLLMLFKKNNT